MRGWTGSLTRAALSLSLIHILRRLTKSAGLRLQTLFGRQYEKTENVATFLAVLELIKGGRIALDDESGAITLRGKKR